MSDPIQSTLDPSAKQKKLDELARALFGAAGPQGQMLQGAANGEGLWFDDAFHSYNANDPRVKTQGPQSGQYRHLPQPVEGFNTIQEILPYISRVWDTPDGPGKITPSWYQNPALVQAARKP